MAACPEEAIGECVELLPEHPPATPLPAQLPYLHPQGEEETGQSSEPRGAVNGTPEAT